MRRGLLLVLAVDAVFAAAAACGSFTGSSTATPNDAASDAAGDVTIADAAADAFDAGICVNFDASPVATSGSVECGEAGPKILGSDPDNCGACGHSCISTQCDGFGHCLPELVLSGTGPALSTIALVDGGLYYAQFSPPAILAGAAVPSDAATTIATISDAEAIQPNSLYGVVFDNDQVFVASYYDIDVAPLGISNFVATTIAEQPTVGSRILGVTNDQYLAFTDGNSFRVWKKDGTVVDEYKNIGGATDIAITPDRKTVVFVARTYTALDGGGSDGGAQRGTLFRWDAANELSPLLEFDTPTWTPTTNFHSLVAADDFTAYFVDGSGAILSTSLEPSPNPPPNVVTSGSARQLGEIIADDSYLFFTTIDPNNNFLFTVSRVSKCGGPETAIFEGEHLDYGDMTSGLVTDPRYLYWGAAGGSSYRVAK